MLRSFGEDYGELLESDESDGSVEAGGLDEASRRGDRRWNRVQTAPRGNAMPQRADQGFALKAEVNILGQRLDGRISTNSKAIGIVDARTRTIEAEAAKLRAELRREVADRKAAGEAMKKSVGDLQQLMVLLPLLSTQSTKNVPGVGNVVIDSGDALSRALPFLFMSGGFGGSTPGGADGGLGMFPLLFALLPR